MRWNNIRAVLVLLLLLTAVLAPILLSGYRELEQARSETSHLEIATHYRNAARRIPWRADLYEVAGTAYYHAHEYQLADEMYRIAFERDTLSPEGWVAWGDVNYLLEERDRGIELWERALLQKDASENLHSRLAQAYQDAADYPAAIDQLRRYLAVRAEDAFAHYRLGLLLTLTDSVTASAELITASQLDPEFDPAAQTLRTALNLASLSASTSERFVIVGRGLGLVGEWKLARAAFESAVEADAEHAEAWAWLGEANQQTGGDGREELDRALALNPNSSTVRGLRGLSFQRLADHHKALVEFRTAMALEPENPARWTSLGDAYVNTGDLIRALEAYQTATILAPNDDEYWRALAKFCGRNNVYVSEVGVPAAQQAVVIAHADSLNLDTLGWLLLLDGRYTEAAQILEAALRADPQNSSAHLHLGMLHLQTNDRPGAFASLIQARDLGSAEADELLDRYFP